MKRKTVAFLLVCALCATAFFGCVPKIPSDLIKDLVDSIPTETDAQSDSSEPSGSDSSGGDLSGGGSSTPAGNVGITAVVDEWTRLSELHSTAINGYTNATNYFVPLQLVMPALTLAMGVQYDMLNIYNADGHFEGNLMFSGYPAKLDRSGMKVTFSCENTVLADDDSGSQKAGDHYYEAGEADLAAYTYKSEDYTERGGLKISRNYIEVLKYSDGSMALLFQYGTEKEDGSSTMDIVFIRAGENVYEYAIAEGTDGTGFKVVSLKSGMDRAQALSAFQANGYTVVESGSEVNGALVTD